MQLSPGDVQRPYPSGTVLPPSAVHYPTDLDQVLNTLDPATRLRLQIVINELGVALTGREADWSQVLQLLPQSLSQGQQLLSQVVTDNHTLASLVAHAGRFVGAVDAQTPALQRLIGAAEQTLTTTEAHQADLTALLQHAPSALRSAQRFLADLETTSRPLVPAAQTLAATAPALTGTLAQLPPFQRAAQPALRQAIQIAPELTALGDQATPILTRLSPTLGTLSQFAAAAQPVTGALNYSVDNILGVLEGWARAIQNRDGISHVFHGVAVVTPALVTSLLNRLGLLAPTTAPSSSAQPAGGHPTTSPTAPKPNPSGTPTPTGTPSGVALPPVVKKLLGGVGGVVNQVTGTHGSAAPGGTQGGNQGAAGKVIGLLNYLLGR